MSSSSYLIVLSVFCILVFVSSEPCQYQFTVDGDAASIAKCPSFDEETGRKVNGMENEMYMSRERINSVAENFGREMNKLENETKTLREWASDLKSDLTGIQVSLNRMTKIEEEVVHLRNLVSGTNESLTPKFAGLQEKLLEIVRDFQKQTTAQMSSFSSILAKTTDMDQTLSQHNGRLSRVEETIGSLGTLPNRVERLDLQEAAQRSDIASLHGEMSDNKQQTALLTATVESMKNTISNLQSKLSDLTNGSSSPLTRDLDERLSAIENWQREQVRNDPSSPVVSKEIQELKEKMGNMSSTVARNKKQMRQMYNVDDKKFNGLYTRLENMGRDIERLKRENNV
ncbi:hypothetical protein FSP39_003308 [Pinctada imbricata]|uniref:Uncharacterized protein n=1 Tax=Pinctada imbricata TaxID=66713 RepID=A0AA89BZT2_PINIB|nr:hypothetical protein FSP39_003308 [Pinctada imbricata]